MAACYSTSSTIRAPIFTAPQRTSPIAALRPSPRFSIRVRSQVCRRLTAPPFRKHSPGNQIRGSRRVFGVRCFKNSSEDPAKNDSKGLNLRVLKRWDVPWNWQTVSLTSLACGISFALTGAIEKAALQYSGIRIEELSLDEKAEILFADQGIATVVVLAVLFSLTKSLYPLPSDIYRYDWKDPFSPEKGWLLWAGIGLVGALAAIAATGAALTFFNGEPPQRETDALIRLIPLIGSSTTSTVCLLGITGVLAPILEETIFRGFFMVSLTKLLPTPIAVLISASVFAVAHLTPGEFPQLFVLGVALGLSYAQTRNLATPITIHALWNSGVVLLLTFLTLQGYVVKDLLQASSS